MFGITLISETVNDRSFVSMAENVWALPFLIALYTLPDNPNQWLYFVRLKSLHIAVNDLTFARQGLASGLLSYPYVLEIMDYQSSLKCSQDIHIQFRY